MAIRNNELTNFGLMNTRKISDSYCEDSKYINIDDDVRKLSCHEGTAQIIVSKEGIAITHSRNGIAIGKNGSVFGGPVHFLNSPSDIRFNMFWRFNDELLTTLPSTLYTPIPVLRYAEPPFIQQISKLFAATANIA